METIKPWLTPVKEMMKRSLAPNVIFGSLLACIEKLMEVEFECPCDPGVNLWLVIGYFVAPAVFIFVVMSVRGCKNKKCSNGWTNNVFMGFAQAILWVILLFIDGNYLACAKTDWVGVYEGAPEAPPRKWCKPKNSTIEQVKTEKWFFLSKLIGLGLILILSLVTAPYMCCFMTAKKEENEDEETIPMSAANQ